MYTPPSWSKHLIDAWGYYAMMTSCVPTISCLLKYFVCVLAAAAAIDVDVIVVAGGGDGDWLEDLGSLDPYGLEREWRVKD